MAKKTTDVYWRGHRVGSIDLYDVDIFRRGEYSPPVRRIDIEERVLISEVADLNPQVVYDRDFVALFGLSSGVTKE